MKQVKLYSDGSSLGNPGPGGWGTILKYNNVEKELSGSEKNTTNNRMELTGVIEGLSQLKEHCIVTIISDSQYVLKGISEWLHGWVRNNWKNSSRKDVKNADLWKKYLQVSKGHQIKTQWVKGHNNHPENERCDRLAVQQAKSIK